MYARYLVISGPNAVPVAVGPFPLGFNALRHFILPAGYESASAHATRAEAEEEAEILARLAGFGH